MDGHNSDACGVGLVGAGTLGRILGRQFASDQRGSLAAVADVDARARQVAGAELQVSGPARYGDYPAMLDGESLDAVVIATPRAFHYEQITAALDRGLDVVCEKPMVVDPQRGNEPGDRIEDSDRVVTTAYQRHLDLSFRRARERYKDGPDIEFVTAEITQGWLEAHGGSWRTDPELSGGGFLPDTGHHVVDAVLWVTGLRPVAVSAAMEFHTPGIDIRANLQIEFEGGATASWMPDTRPPRPVFASRSTSSDESR